MRSKLFFSILFITSFRLGLGQSAVDSAESGLKNHHLVSTNRQADSTFDFLFTIGTSFYSAQDKRIDNWLQNYGYRVPNHFTQGINISVKAIPFNSKMMFSVSGGAIISRQDMVTAGFTIGAYRLMVSNRRLKLFVGAGVGRHGDRVLLNHGLPPSLDSLAKLYNKTLSLHRAGFLFEPAARLYWYLIQTRVIKLGLFAECAYDASFNARWKVGYYNQNEFTSFRRLGKPSNLATQKESGWAVSTGLSFLFPFQ